MSSDLFQCIEKALLALLLPRGFTRKGSLLLRYSGDVFHLVQPQGSSANTRTESKCNVNLGVWVPALAPGEKPALASAHWRQRLGMVCPEHSDTWWQTSPQQSAPELAAEVAARVERYALPAFASVADAHALLVIWRGGNSPGLTKVQASRFTHSLAGLAP